MADRTAMTPSRAAAVSVLIALAVVVVGLAFAQATPGPELVRSCTTIDEPGEYALVEDIVDDRKTRLSQTCIRITADDVVFDGRGHVVDGKGISDTTGVTVVDATNVTVRNVRLSDWNRGVYYRNASRGVIRGLNATRNARGIDLDGSSDVVLADNVVARNLIGIDLDRENRNVSLSGNTVAGNFYVNVYDEDGTASRPG